MADPTLYNVENGRDLAKEINAIVNRDKGIANAAAPFVHTGYNSSNYIYTAKNVGSGGKVANWRTSADALLLQANDTGVTVGVGLGLPWLTQGSIPIVGTTGALTEDHANLFWNQTSHFLGIGMTLPTVRVDVAGAMNASDVIRARGNSGTGLTGKGVEIQHNGTNAGGILSYDRSAGTYLDMDVAGRAVTLSVGATAMVAVNATGVGVKTTGPTSDFDVNGAAIVRGALLVDATTFKVDNATHKVGVNQPSPQSLLEIAGRCRVTDVIGGATTGTGIEMYYAPSGAAGVVRVIDAATAGYLALFLAGNPTIVGLTTGHAVGFYGNAGTTQQTLSGAAATSSAALSLVNDIRSKLITLGLFT